MEKQPYFAFGSNMLERELLAHAPGARSLGGGVLRGYRLAFTRWSERRGGGVADIVEDAGGEVWGVLYEVPVDELPALDAKERVPTAYRRTTVRVEDAGGRALDAMAYEVVDRTGAYAPAASYLAIVIEGAREHWLPTWYVEGLAAPQGA
jgi:cation transport regulator ChaC